MYGPLFFFRFPRIQYGNYLLFPLLFQNKSSLLRICHCQTLEEKKNPISKTSIAEKRRRKKMSFILHNVVPNDFNTVADFEVFLLNWKNGKWRHQDAGLRRSVLSKSFVPLSYWVFSFNFETINIPKFGTPEQIRIDQTLWNTNDNLRPVPWWCHVPFFQYR